MPDDDNDLIENQDDQLSANELATEGLVQNIQNNSEITTQNRSGFAKFINFVKKHKIVLIVVIVTTIVLAVLYVSIPVIGIGKLKLANAGTVLKLEQDQTARLKVSDVSVKVVSFTDESCPAGNTCFGSGQKAVEYRLTIDGKQYATGSQTPLKNTRYKIETVESDYKTYANIKIVKLK